MPITLENKSRNLNPGMEGRLAHDSHKVSPSKLILSLLHGEKKEIAIVLLYGVGVGLLSLAIPVGVQTLVSNVNFGSLSQPILFLVLAVFLGLKWLGSTSILVGNFLFPGRWGSLRYLLEVQWPIHFIEAAEFQARVHFLPLILRLKNADNSRE